MKDEQPLLTFIRPDTSTERELPLAASGVAAGFPSPAEEYLEPSLDLNRALVRNPASTFFVRVAGDSMQGDHIHDGDLLIVDKAVEPYDGCVAVCFLDGEFTLKRVCRQHGRIVLMPSNDRYPPIPVEAESEFAVWGVVTYSIRRHR